MQPVFKGYDFIGSGISEKIYENGLCLPSDTKTTDEDLGRVCSAIKKAIIKPAEVVRLVYKIF
jgi:dTDP-4-amino-4,6-dideoxygalactose transaminase